MKFGTFFSQVTASEQKGEVKSEQEALLTYKELGLDYVDIDSAPLSKSRPAKEFLKELKDCGVYVGSAFCWHKFPHDDPEALKEMKEFTKFQLDYVAAVDCNIYMPVPFVGTIHESAEARRVCQDKVAEYFADVVELAKPYGIQPVLENYSSTTCPFATIDDIAYLLEKVPGIDYVLDAGNYWFNDSDVVEATKLFIDKIAHVHLKDIVKTTDGPMVVDGRYANSVAIGSGEIPFEEIFAILTENGYDKTMTVEINGGQFVHEKTMESLRYLSRVFR